MGGFKEKRKSPFHRQVWVTLKGQLPAGKASQRNNEQPARGRSKGSQGCLILEKNKQI